MIGPKMSKLKAIKDRILCIEGDFGDQVTEAGIIVKATIGKAEGTTPRWFKVFEVGPDVDWLTPGQWVYVEYGRWSEGFTCKDDRLEEGQKIWLVENKACMAVADEKPASLNISSTNQSINPF
jgi:hypothetical protein